MTKSSLISPYRITLRTILGTLTALIAIGGISYYAYLRTRDIAEGPVVVIYTPADGHTNEEAILTVSGIARHIAYLSLNGRQIFTRQDGTFEEKLLLASGYTILSIVGRDKFDRETTITRRVVYNP